MKSLEFNDWGKEKGDRGGLIYQPLSQSFSFFQFDINSLTVSFSLYLV